MADFIFDPRAATNGDGSQETPFNTWAGRTLVAGNRYLQVLGTTFKGSIGPLGTGGTATSRIIIGVCDPDTFEWLPDVKGGATVDATGQTYGFNITEARPYITVAGFEVIGGTAACLYKASTASSSSEAQYCWLENCILRNSLGAGADMRGKGNRLRNCDVYNNASDGLFIVGDDFELAECRVFANGLTNANGDCVQLRDSSNFHLHDSLLDHSQSPYKQALIASLLNVAGTTGGKVVNCDVSCAQYEFGRTTAEQKTVQIIVPGVTILGCRIQGGQYAVYLEGEGTTIESSIVEATGQGPVLGIAVRAVGISVLGNTVVGSGLGSIGIDHSSADYTGVNVQGNALVSWPQGIRTAAAGATYSHNAFEGVAVMNSDLAGAEGAAGTGDVTDPLLLGPDYEPALTSPLLGVAAGLGPFAYGRRARYTPPAIGAREPLRTRSPRT